MDGFLGLLFSVSECLYNFLEIAFIQRTQDQLSIQAQIVGGQQSMSKFLESISPAHFIEDADSENAQACQLLFVRGRRNFRR